MSKRDFHLHPNLLKRPEQADLFIRKAIELGFDEICFTDHMPFSVTGDEHDRIPFGKVGEYCQRVREKADEYRDRITIKTGIEIDFHPDCRKEIEAVLAAGDFDYVLGSSHLNIAGFGLPFGKLTRSEFARTVLENDCAAIDSGYFDTVSHLDVYRWVFSEPTAYPLIDDRYRWESQREFIETIFEHLVARGVRLEINAAPFYKGFDTLGPYPENGILQLSRRYPLAYVYGSDAHSPDKVGYGYDRIAAEGWLS